VLKVTHTTCGHQWSQIILPGLTEVCTCPVCEELEAEHDAAFQAQLLRDNDNDQKRLEEDTHA